MTICDVNIEIVQGDGEGLSVDAVALESLEDDGVQEGKGVSVIAGTGHSCTIIARLNFDRTLHDVECVRQGYADVLHKAVELNVKSLALLPFGFEKGIISPSASAKVLAQELLKFLRFAPHHMERIYICVTDTEHFDILEKNVIGYMTHVQNTLGMGPYVTVDAIVELPQGIVIIERSNPPYGWALPGGFVDYGESLEAAIAREIKEETDLALQDVRQFKTYSDPRRDPRFHTVSTVFIARGVGIPKAGDDAGNLRVLGRSELLNYSYAFDHQQVISEYLDRWPKGCCIESADR